MACRVGKADGTGDKDHISLLVLTDGGEFSGEVNQRLFP